MAKEQGAAKKIRGDLGTRRRARVADHYGINPFELTDAQLREMDLMIEPMQAMRLLREHAYSMDSKKAHELALVATDDRGFADDLWERIQEDKMASKHLSE